MGTIIKKVAYPTFLRISDMSLTGDPELDKQISNHSTDYMLVKNDLASTPLYNLVVPEIDKSNLQLIDTSYLSNKVLPSVVNTGEEPYGLVGLPEITVTPQGAYREERTTRKAIPIKNVKLVKAADIQNKNMLVETENGVVPVSLLDPNYEVYLDENQNPVSRDEIKVANYIANRPLKNLSFTEQMENLFHPAYDNPVFGQRRVDNYNKASKSNYDYMDNVWGSTLSNISEFMNVASDGTLNWMNPATLVGAIGQLANGEEVTYWGNKGFFELTPETKKFYDEHPWLGNTINAVGAIALPKAVGTVARNTPIVLRNAKTGFKNWVEVQPRMDLNGRIINPGEKGTAAAESGTVGYGVTSTRNGGYKGHVGVRHGSQMSVKNHGVKNGYNAGVTGEGSVPESQAPSNYRASGSTLYTWKPKEPIATEPLVSVPTVWFPPTTPPKDPPTDPPITLPIPEYRYEDYRADPFYEWFAKQPERTTQYYSGSEGHPAGQYKIERDPNYKGGYVEIRRVGDENGSVIPDSTSYIRRETFMDMPKGNPVYILDDGSVPAEAERSKTEKIDISRAKYKK